MKVEVAVQGSPVPNGPYGFCGRKATFEVELRAPTSEFRSCVKVEVAVQGSPVPKRPYGLCRRKATLKLKFEPPSEGLRGCVKVEVAVQGSPVPNNPYGLYGGRTTLNLNPACVQPSSARYTPCTARTRCARGCAETRAGSR